MTLTTNWLHGDLFLQMHACMGGFSKTVIYLSTTNNCANTVLSFFFFQNCVSQFVLPLRVRGDMRSGKCICCTVWGTDWGSFIVGRSVCNQNIENTCTKYLLFYGFILIIKKGSKCGIYNGFWKFHLIIKVCNWIVVSCVNSHYV